MTSRKAVSPSRLTYDSLAESPSFVTRGLVDLILRDVLKFSPIISSISPVPKVKAPAPALFVQIPFISALTPAPLESL